MGEALTAVTRGWSVQAAAVALAPAVGAGEAALLASVALVEAEVLGQPRFGLDLLDELGGAGGMPEMQPGALSLIECSGRFGPLCVAAATLGLLKSCQALGLSGCWLRGLRGFGRLGPYLRPLADAGLVAWAAVQAPPFVAPDGGTRPVVGTNPVGFAAGRGADQLVIDVATSNLTMAEFKQARSSGALLPWRSAISKDGAPTTAVEDFAAALPRGGRIGSLMGLMAEVLAGVAGDARDDPAGRGLFVLAVDPARLHPQGWTLPLAGLHDAWIEAGGHWPQGRSVPADTPLPPKAADRLEHWLDRLGHSAADKVNA